MSAFEDLAAIATERGAITRAIHGCTSCSRHYGCSIPTTFNGPAPARLMAIGESPGLYEEKAGTSWRGGNGRWLAELLHEVKLPEMHEWFLTNAVKCHGAEGSTIDPEHIVACSAHLRREVALCDPEWVLTFGATALAMTGAKATLAKVHGRPFKMVAGAFKDRWIMPTYHPAAAKRDEKRAPDIAADMANLRGLLSGVIDRDAAQLVVGRGGRLLSPA